MAKRQSKVQKLHADLAELERSISEDSQGHAVFTNPLLEQLFQVLDDRFGGCLVSSTSSHPPYWGLWHPTGSLAADAEKDYVTTIQIFANPIEPTNRFFSRLKQILKTCGSIEQQEILISRIDCWLM